jgi:two-component system, chemotaxis family, sensor kinase CheA
MTADARSRSTRPDSVAPESMLRVPARDRVLVIDDSDDSRMHTVALLGDAGYLLFEQPSPIGATRILLGHAIPAVVVDLGMPGLSGEKLIAVLRKNPRLEGVVIVVVTSVDGPHDARRQGLSDADAVVLREHLDTRLVPTMQRLLCTSGFHQKASVLAG